MSNKILNTYERYKAMVDKAHELKCSNEAIIKELRDEIQSIEVRCQRKQIIMAGNKTPYPAREARRAATECIMVIERIIRELNEEK